jgi:hypothetical protein
MLCFSVLRYSIHALNFEVLLWALCFQGGILACTSCSNIFGHSIQASIREYQQRSAHELSVMCADKLRHDAGYTVSPLGSPIVLTQ